MNTMEKTTKITKKDNFNAIVEVLETAGRADLADVIRHEIDLLNAKSSKAKARAAEKKAENDALTDIVISVLGEDFETIPTITEKVNEVDETATVSKVQYRLVQLVKSGVAESSEIKVSDGTKSRTLKGYKKVIGD